MSSNNPIRKAVKTATAIGKMVLPVKQKSPAGTPCPVICLGHLDGSFYFLDAIGQLRILSARQLDTKAELMGLFLDQGFWLREQFPCKKMVKSHDGDGNDIEELKTVDFQKNQSSAWLMSECRAAGLYGEHLLIRRPGVWPGENGRPIVHSGDRIYPTALRSERVGTRSGHQVWAAAPPEPRPASVAATVEDVRYLLSQIEKYWNFRKDNGSIILCGLLACCYYGAAIQWRPAGFLTGAAGSGKSTLLSIIRAACPMSFYTNDTTKAGLEQSLDGRAMPSFIDEASDREDQRGARALLDLVLSASGGEGTRGSRGGKEGKARHIEVAGSILMASIAAPDMKAQHFGRFTVIDLNKAAPGADYNAEHRKLMAWAKRNGPSLWARALNGWERLQQANSVLRSVLLSQGCSPRDIDQMAALLSGYWVLAHDDSELTPIVAQGIVSIASNYLRDETDVLLQDDASQLISYLLTQIIQINRSTERRSIAELITQILGEDKNNDEQDDDFETRLRREDSLQAATDALARYGIRVIRADEVGKGRGGLSAPRVSEGVGVWFHPGSSPLQKLFEGTQWSGQRFETALRRLETARRYKKQIRIGSLQCRGCVWVAGSELGFGERASDG